MKIEYPWLEIGYEYDSECNEFDIWHNSYELGIDNIEFARVSGKLIRRYLFNRNIYSFSFGYDHKRDKKI